MLKGLGVKFVALFFRYQRKRF